MPIGGASEAGPDRQNRPRPPYCATTHFAPTGLWEGRDRGWDLEWRPPCSGGEVGWYRSGSGINHEGQSEVKLRPKY